MTTENCTKHQHNISKTLLRQKLCLQQLVITDIFSHITLNHPLCLSKSADQTWWPAWKPGRAMAGFTYIVGPVPWQGTKENNTWQGRRASHHSEKRLCWPQQLLPHLSFPWPSEATTTTPPRYRLYWGHGLILAILNSSLKFSLPFPPLLYPTTRWYLHSTLRKKFNLLQQRSVKHALEILKAPQWAKGTPARTAPLRG